jgi:predicted GNAT family acetyltransferase
MIEKDLTLKYDKCINALDIYENKSSLRLTRIIVKDECRGDGVGSNIMTDLINYADKNKQIITLTPSSDFGGNKNRLIQFYKSIN